MEILHDISLKPFNTFGIDVSARSFAEAASEKDVRMLFQSAGIVPVPADKEDMLILGGGSNILFTEDHEGLVLKISMMGIDKVKEDDEYIWIKAAAGENWDHFVRYCVEKGFGGLENLSGIPGSVGAAPIQNIGAYGVEMKECFDSLQAFDMERGETTIFHGEDCHFGYRDSIFKQQLRGRLIILSVTFRLSKQPRFNLTYQALRDKIASQDSASVDLHAVREAVMSVRSSKLPDPVFLGNAGSFFKNPQVDRKEIDRLLSSFPDLVYFPVEGAEGSKLAAGWLIEKCGWKGYRKGDAGVHDKQALVLVNHGKAGGQEILELAMEIRDSVHEKFGVLLDPEVRIV